MEFTVGDNVKPEHKLGIERDEIDRVSGWIMSLTIGMIVLGAVFAVLDRYDFFSTVQTSLETTGSLSAITR